MKNYTSFAFPPYSSSQMKYKLLLKGTPVFHPWALPKEAKGNREQRYGDIFDYFYFIFVDLLSPPPCDNTIEPRRNLRENTKVSGAGRREREPSGGGNKICTLNQVLVKALQQLRFLRLGRSSNKCFGLKRLLLDSLFRFQFLSLFHERKKKEVKKKRVRREDFISQHLNVFPELIKVGLDRWRIKF